MLWDAIARHGVTMGGLGVIATITLIFFYLLYVVIPLLQGVEVDMVGRYSTPGAGKTLYLAMEEQTEIGLRLTDLGHTIFFDTTSARVVSDIPLPLPRGARVTSVATGEAGKEIYAFGLSNGSALVFRVVYDTSFPDDKRVITPRVLYPLGNKAIEIGRNHRPIEKIAVQLGEESATIVTITGSAAMLGSFTKEESMLDEDEAGWIKDVVTLAGTGKADYVLMDADQRRLYLADDDGNISFFDISNKQAPRVVERIRLSKGKSRLSTLKFLAGSISLMAGFADGRIVQWFPVRDEKNIEHLTEIRGFHEQRTELVDIVPEYFRKGFLAADSNGQVGIYHSTAGRTLKVLTVAQSPIVRLAVSPRANAMLVEDNTRSEEHTSELQSH